MGHAGYTSIRPLAFFRAVEDAHIHGPSKNQQSSTINNHQQSTIINIPL